ncbi:MAG: hypothetical protein AAB724_01725 [Patescibacteria group bacterium]
MLEKFFAARHSIRPEGEDVESTDYRGISEKGEELAKAKAKEVLELLENAESGTVMFLGGATEQTRTKSTSRVFGDEIKRTVKEENKDIIVLTEEDISQEKGPLQAVREVVKKIEANPDKKFLINFPLRLKGFSMLDDEWFKKDDGQPTDFYTALEEFDDSVALKKWIEGQGVLGNLKGPNPTAVAEKQLESIKRLQEFAKNQIGARPLIVGSIGHAWNLDALAIYLANNGKVNLEGLAKVGGESIKQTQMVKVEIKDGQAKVIYNDKEFLLEENKKDVDQKV